MNSLYPSTIFTLQSQDALAEEGNALHLFDAQIADVGEIVPQLVIEFENGYENFDVFQELLYNVNDVHEILQNLRQDVRNGFRGDLDGASIDVHQEARNRLATELINTVGTAVAHRGGDAAYPIQVLLAILMERFLDGHAGDGDVEILNAIVRDINV